ncbi:hypothetical protein NQZ68_032228 [Dissostichus eleginoides]|nr:hypothetical protein NQZ68_032228 [Dissostichus eleginoides]
MEVTGGERDPNKASSAEPIRPSSDKHTAGELHLQRQQTWAAGSLQGSVPAEKARQRNPEVAFVPKSKREQERH